MARARGHQELDHPADLLLRFWAPNEEDLLVEAAQALVEVLTQGTAVAAKSSRTVRLEALDPADRLVRWLNEVLLLATCEGFVLADAQVTIAGSGSEASALQAVVVGDPDGGAVLRTEVKSVTYHALELRRLEQGFVGQVLIDV